MKAGLPLKVEAPLLVSVSINSLTEAAVTTRLHEKRLEVRREQILA